MHRIRPWLSIGTLRDSHNQALLHLEGIQAILQVAEPITDTQRIVYCLPITDTQPIESHILAAGVTFIRTQHEAGHRILIACEGGISRSSAFTIAGLKHIEGHTLVETLKDIRRQHPHAWPSWELWCSLCNYFGEPSNIETYWQAML